MVATSSTAARLLANVNLCAIRKDKPANAPIIVRCSSGKHGFSRGRLFKTMDRKMDMLIELSPLEIERCHHIQESLLEDRLVGETAETQTGQRLLQAELHLDHIGTVDVSLSTDSLVWKSTKAEEDTFTLPCFRLASQPHELPVAEIYAVEPAGFGPVRRFIGPSSMHQLLKPVARMHRFVVHSFQRQRNKWIPKTFTFGHPELEVCQSLISSLQSLLQNDARRPKNILVLVNPFGGKGIASSRWDMVAPLFRRAGVKTKVIHTERAGHAFDVISKAEKGELESYDGVVVVGGDGVFNEALNGLASQRHLVPLTPTPQQVSEGLKNSASGSNDLQPLLTNSPDDNSPPPCSDALFSHGLSSLKPEPVAPWLRVGIIPAGSTDTIVVSTTGTRDPVTAALHIVLGDSMPLDVVRLTGWKDNDTSEVRYAASFAGYGFYGDVAKESEYLRWMGPARYDVAGTKVFARHRNYEAELSYLEVPASKRTICRFNCEVCAQGLSEEAISNLRWGTSRGFFHSVGAAIMTCRNDKAPDGVVSHAHLSDGLLDLILIKPCSRPAYLRQLIELTRRGGDPLAFDFVEHHKTPIFTFVAHGQESVWNVDGEIFPARKLTAQVFRGLINIFARGPEV